jgi:hypothetical protein
MHRIALGCAVVMVCACASPSPTPSPYAPSSIASTPSSAPTSATPAKDESDGTHDETETENEADSPKEPPYDLAADLNARTESIKGELGAKTKFEVVEDVFLIAAPSGQLGSAAVVTKKALAAYFNGRFDKKPAHSIAVLLFDDAKPYNAYCKSKDGSACITPFGFYDDHTIVMNVAPGIGTLTHELVHPIVEADFPKAPTWINEGIASLYEAFSLPKPGEIRGQKNWRHPRLLKALKSKTERAYASLPALFALTDTEFRGTREDLNYATARYFCQWMDAQNKLWPFYHAWRDHFADDPTGEKAFASTMGKTIADLDGTWATWVKAL